jgi:hypothetical protein
MDNSPKECWKQLLHNVCEQNKVTVDDKSLKEQSSLMKQNEEQFKNIPDPVYS